MTDVIANGLGLFCQYQVAIHSPIAAVVINVSTCIKISRVSGNSLPCFIGLVIEVCERPGYQFKADVPGNLGEIQPRLAGCGTRY